MIGQPTNNSVIISAPNAPIVRATPLFFPIPWELGVTIVMFILLECLRYFGVRHAVSSIPSL